MDWVKLTTDYYRDFAIALGDDAREVMFTRGIALVGETESGGFIPDQLLHTLTRRPQQAARVARGLVKEDVWERVAGGYRVVNWGTINAELERYAEKKRRDRERKRAARRTRVASADVSADAGADTSADDPAPCPVDRLYESESKSKTAAAAAVGVHPGPVTILRSKLDARRLVVRWDKLNPQQLQQIVDLVELHGDGPLVKQAVASFQPDNPPVFAQAWIENWLALPAPGTPLQLAPDPACAAPGHSGTTRHCTQCASERLAGDAR